MPERSFSELLALLESYGWVLLRIKPPYRVFAREGKLLVFPVRDRKVSEAYVDKINKILEDTG